MIDTLLDLDVNEDNVAPESNPDTYSFSIFELPFLISTLEGVLSNDEDPDGDILVAVLESQTENGIVQLNEDGSFSYSPSSGFIGLDSFTYIAFDGLESSLPTRVRIQVEVLPEPPADAILGTRESERLRGEETANYILGLGGNDFINGRSDDDILGGNGGDDTLFGRKGFDIIDGGLGDDYLDGGRDQDILFGRAGSDTLKGQRGDDLLIGGNGNDTLKGHSGSDTLIGGKGNDFLQGGDGTDVFVLSPFSGVDRFNDFVEGEDKIGLTEQLSFELLSFESLGKFTQILADDALIAVVQVREDGNLAINSNFIEF